MQAIEGHKGGRESSMLKQGLGGATYEAKCSKLLRGTGGGTLDIEP